MLSIIWLLCFLVVTASDDLMTSLETIRLQQKIKEKAESMLRFPFIHSLVDPCDFSSNMFHSEDEAWKDLTGNGRIPLVQHSLGYIRPHLGDVHQFTELLELNDARREEEQSSLTKEFQLVVSQTLHLISSIYSPSALRKCDGYQLESLPRDKLFVLSSTEGPQLQPVYEDGGSLSSISQLMSAVIPFDGWSTQSCEYSAVQQYSSSSGSYPGNERLAHPPRHPVRKR